MLPTPDTSHVPYSRVYEPAEDSFLMIDTLALPAETAFLQARFSPASSASPVSPPFVVEIGSGSGVVLAFVVAQAAHLFGPGSQAGPLALAVDVNAFACAATTETVRRATEEEQRTEKRDVSIQGGNLFLGAVRADLVSALRPGQVDVLLFNPPYVPTPTLPATQREGDSETPDALFARDSHLLELAYAGGHDGMETTDRLLAALPTVLSARGCAYVLLCAQNRPETVKERVRGWSSAAAATTTSSSAGDGEDAVEGEQQQQRCWRAETVGSSGKQAGWEKLQIVRIWRE